MGCAVGTGSRSQLRDAQRQVDALRKQLEAKELENVDLRHHIEGLRSTSSSAPPKITGSGGTDPNLEEVRIEGREEAEGEDDPGDRALAADAASSGANLEPDQALVPALTVPPEGFSESPAARSPGHLPAIEEGVRFTDGFLPGTLPEEAEGGRDVEDDSAGQCHRLPPPGIDVEPGGAYNTGAYYSATEEAPGCAANEDHEPGTSTRPTRADGTTLDPDKVVAVKASNSWESDTSTCAPVQAAAVAAPSSLCHQCNHEVLELYLDPADMNQYCEQCWNEYYGQAPARHEMSPLVLVEVIALWLDDQLAQAWARQLLPGWPPALPGQMPAPPGGAEVWSNISVRVRRDVVGPHAREHFQGETSCPGDVLAGRYRVEEAIGEGHFTKAFLAEDLQHGGRVCLKRHRSLAVEALADLMVLGSRLEEVDPECQHFPRLTDAMFDIVCYTVESLVDGQDCLAVARASPGFFTDMEKLSCVAHGTLSGLSLLEAAGVVHNDIKPDNLIWIEAQPWGRPSIRIVDFGQSRLDKRLENGRNWSLAEGGAGHLGKWSPEMILRLPITPRGDVWGLAICLCELLTDRSVWRNEADTAEVVLAQALGLCNLRDGLPSSLLRRSPLDIRLLYTPAPQHFPLRRNEHGRLEVLGPTRWGLEQVLDEGWQETERADLGELLLHALVVDPDLRPSAAQLLEDCRFAARPQGEGQSEEVHQEDVELQALPEEVAMPEGAASHEEARSAPPCEGEAADGQLPEDAEHNEVLLGAPA